MPVIATCSHFSTRIAAERSLQAAEVGAAMIMLMPPYHGATLKATDQYIHEHFARIGEAAEIPIMVQDAPLSGVELSVDLLARIATEIEQVCYFKIETPMAAAKLRSLIEAGGGAIEGPFDGEESITLMADLDAGATGTMPSALLPDLIKPIVEHYRAARTDEAAAHYARILPLINLENRQCGLRACKAIMVEGGVIESDYVRHPAPPLHPATRAEFFRLAKQFDPLALRWGR